ncbi:ABC transporter [Adlercreutzia equolifaciens]|uniref:ABC transporter n=1 Tax=Adlercreutzia equolifaciens TaxID=446660 RepID=A0A6L8Q2Q5_9ACTN|nr:ABC transporter permease [Adlercreutzia equolifaciens]MZG27578.1 ABC transporter [Adlercreutzia equolifaciens]
MRETRIVGTLSEILKEQWQWRKQILSLGLFDLKKISAGAVLGPLWFFAKPAVYILVFWFALEVGLRSADQTGSDVPYILWLMGGLIPWFYIQEILGTGINIFKRYSYLVTKIKFPLAGIPTIFSISTFVIQLGLVVALLVVYFICGQPLDLYLLQLPVALVLMFVFFNMFSLVTSLLSAISKDFMNLMKTLSTPLFWLSGIIFNVYNLQLPLVELVLMLNPITFIVTMYRCAVYDKMWIWDKPEAIIGFVVVFVVTLLVTLVIYRRTHEEVADVL